MMLTFSLRKRLRWLPKTYEKCLVTNRSTKLISISSWQRKSCKRKKSSREMCWNWNRIWAPLSSRSWSTSTKSKRRSSSWKRKVRCHWRMMTLRNQRSRKSLTALTHPKTLRTGLKPFRSGSSFRHKSSDCAAKTTTNSFKWTCNLQNIEGSLMHHRL